MKRLIFSMIGALSVGTSAVCSASTLEAVPTFGANPGKLAMYREVPAGMAQHAPLVVVLHGCTEGASDIASAGWSAVADAMKIYVVYPQQPTSNNPVSCFDWFGQYNNPADKTNITRGGGEAESIKEMVDAMKAAYSIDPKRVYVAGFSAGAAMAAVMLATYPDVFAAGGIAAGVPYDCPSTQNSDVFQCMNPGKTLDAAQWGTFVKNAFAGFSGAYPRVSIWQGTQDTTVGTANSGELVKQWTNVHALSATPTSQGTVDGAAHDVFASASGQVMVERYAIAGMAHAFPIDAAHGCGAAGSYAADEKICAARHMVEFFLDGASSGVDAGAGGGSSGGGGGGGSGGSGGSPNGANGGGAGSGGNGGAVADGGDCANADWSYPSKVGGCAVSAAAPSAGAPWSPLAIAGAWLAAIGMLARRRRS